MFAGCAPSRNWPTHIEGQLTVRADWTPGRWKRLISQSSVPHAIRETVCETWLRQLLWSSED